MPTQAQLEIIAPTGEMEFHDLDPGKGVANIGRHPDNDVVIDGPGIAAFHAVLDYRQTPFQIMLLAEEGETRLRGRRLAANAFAEVRNWDTIEVDGYAIILLEGEGVVPAAPPPPPPAPPLPREPAPPEKEAVVPRPPVGPVVWDAIPPDLADEIILTEISGREWTVDVEQTASFQVAVTNGGEIVAAFDVRVEGVPESWVTITPAEFNLNERAQAMVSISITPPRLTTSRAGSHPLAVVATSANYPGHASRLGGLLIINPYHEFTVGDLSPKQQTVSWFRRAGQVTLPITNQSNSEAPFRLDGEDDERGLRFEFEVPGVEVALAKQAEMRLPPDETYFIPIEVTPLRRRLIALRSRMFNFTITTTLVESALTPRSVMGRLKARPLIGPFFLLLFILGTVTLIAFLFMPNQKPILEIDTSYPSANETITLEYNASRFPSFRPRSFLNHMNSWFLDLTLEYRSRDGEWQVLPTEVGLDKPDGAMTDLPPANGRYRLRANTWVSKILPLLEGVSDVAPVYVTPVEPTILDFSPNKNPIWAGEDVVLSWEVIDADVLRLVYNGIEETLTEEELERGQRIFPIETDTTFTLIARNTHWDRETVQPLAVTVLHPTPTPIPTPVILRFDVDPQEILEGETVRIDWEVSGADSVAIDPGDQGLPVKGNIGYEPTGLTTYKLTAYKSAPDGTQVKNESMLKEVVVNPQPSPTPVPQAPQIQLFQATPKEIVGGEGNQVKLTWSVSGSLTKIDITNPELVFSTPISGTGTITVTPRETTLYVLTAYNGDLSSSMPAEVNVLEPTPTPTATPVPTEPPPPTPTPTPFPPPVIRYYKAEGLDPGTDRVVFMGSSESGNGTVYQYEVEVGARVKISWLVDSAETVTIEGFGTQPTEGSLVVPDAVTSDASYMLTAENNGGANQVSAFLQFKVTSTSAPPAPYSVRGTEDVAAKTNKIEWSYDDQYRGIIVGFRIYRADVPPEDTFLPVGLVEDPNATEWTDEGLDETCGKAYYVVATYIDPVRDEEKETDASSTSWYSRPCR